MGGGDVLNLAVLENSNPLQDMTKRTQEKKKQQTI